MAAKAVSVVARAAGLLKPRASVHKVGAIGLDISLEAMHLVQLESGESGRPAVRARISLPIGCSREELLQSPSEFRALLKRAFASRRFRGKKVVMALPATLFRTVSINYRHSGSKSTEAAAILRVMQDRLDGDLSNYVLDYLPVRGRQKSEEKLAMVAVCERDKVVSFLELGRKAGLDVAALEIGPLAICRLMPAIAGDDESSTILIINSGRDRSYLTLISDSDLLFDQEVAIGEKSLVQHICKTLELSEDMASRLLVESGISAGHANDATANAIDESGLYNTLAEILKPQFIKLVEEIKRAFLYAASVSRGRGITKVYLMGSIARWPGSEQLLSNLSDCDIENVPDPLAMFPSIERDTAVLASHAAPELAVATGLALRGLKGND